MCLLIASQTQLSTRMFSSWFGGGGAGGSTAAGTSDDDKATPLLAMDRFVDVPGATATPPAGHETSGRHGATAGLTLVDDDDDDDGGGTYSFRIKLVAPRITAASQPRADEPATAPTSAQRSNRDQGSAFRSAKATNSAVVDNLCRSEASSSVATAETTATAPATSVAAVAPGDASGVQLVDADADDAPPALSARDVHKTYLIGVTGVPALRGVTLDVRIGELLCVYGTSGGGKSSLLNLLGTIDTPTKGDLRLFDARVNADTPDAVLAALRCRHIGFVFQAFNLLPTMDAVDNVALPMVIAGDRPTAAIRQRATELLRSVGLGHRLTHYPGQLSGGEQQRVSIARALANNPDVLLMDEPTGDLDTQNAHLTLQILLRLNVQQKVTMVLVTHDAYLKAYASRVLYMRDGKVGRVEAVDPRKRAAAVAHLLETDARVAAACAGSVAAQQLWHRDPPPHESEYAPATTGAHDDPAQPCQPNPASAIRTGGRFGERSVRGAAAYPGCGVASGAGRAKMAPAPSAAESRLFQSLFARDT